MADNGVNPFSVLAGQITPLAYAVILGFFLYHNTKRIFELIDRLVTKVVSIAALDFGRGAIEFKMTEGQAKYVVDDILQETLDASQHISDGDLRIFQAIYNEWKRGRTISANDLFLEVEGALPDETNPKRERQGQRLGFVRIKQENDPNEQERKDRQLSPLERERLDRLRRLRGINLIRPAKGSYWGPDTTPVLSAFAEYILRQDPVIGDRLLKPPPPPRSAPEEPKADRVRDDSA
ncbi:MAG: hypothetical protein AB7H70_05415 [Rhodospirillaceae bacterium]